MLLIAFLLISWKGISQNDTIKIHKNIALKIVQDLEQYDKLIIQDSLKNVKIDLLEQKIDLLKNNYTINETIISRFKPKLEVNLFSGYRYNFNSLNSVYFKFTVNYKRIGAGIITDITISDINQNFYFEYKIF